MIAQIVIKIDDGGHQEAGQFGFENPRRAV
jgi:hypothetical protein